MVRFTGFRNAIDRNRIYGVIYITDGETNATLPRDLAVEELTFERALDLLATRAAKGGTKKKATRKKATAKKVAKKVVKKAAKKKVSKKVVRK